MDPEHAAAYEYVDTDESLARLSERVQQAERVALDTEGNSLHNYFEKVCLIQVSVGGDQYIVDPLSGVNLDAFFEAIASTPLIFHAADYDLRILRASHDFKPKFEVFDTMLAAQLLGYNELGLAQVVYRHFDVKLAKGGQKSNWTRRPLSEGQLTYAADDTRFLDELCESLRQELAEKDRLDWHRQACQKMVDAAMNHTRPDPDETWRIRGMGSRPPRELNYVRELWRWRDSEARRIDRPPFRIMGNKDILSLAEWGVSRLDGDSGGALEDRKEIPKRITPAQFSRLKHSVQCADEMPEENWPGPRKKNGPQRMSAEEKHCLDRLSAARTHIATELEVEPSVIAPRAALESIVRAQAKSTQEILTCSTLMSYQAALLEPLVRDVFQEMDSSS